MSGYDPYSLVVSKAQSVITEGLPTSQGPGGSSITPSTLTALVGLSQGGALQKAPSVITAIAAIRTEAAVQFAANTTQSLIDSATLTSAADNIENSGNTLFGGSSAIFTQKLQAVHTHITDTADIKKVTDLVSSSTYSDYGTGISSASGMATRGLDTTLGNLSDAGNVVEAMGPLYDLSDMSTFATGNGFVSTLTQNKLGNISGVDIALQQAGVDINDINNEVYAPTITKVLTSSTDSATIATIKEHFGITADLTTINDFTSAAKIANNTTIDTAALGGKLNELNANFNSPADANAILSAIEIPNIPNLEAAAPTLTAQMANLTPTIDNITGTGDGPNGIPSMTNFMQSVSGGPTIDAVNASAVTVASAQAASNAIDSSNALLGKVGLQTVPLTLATLSSFTGNLHKFGDDAIGSGVGDVLKTMATADQYGDAIRASLAEGKNNALLKQAGISPPTFT